MKLKFKQTDAEVKSAFSQGLALASYLGEPYSPQHAYHVVAYSLSLKNLAANGKGIDEAVKPVGWQCFATKDSDPQYTAVVAEVAPIYSAPRQSGPFVGPMKMTSLFYGDAVNEGYTKARDLYSRAGSSDFPPGDYEPRILRIPGLLITAFWMKSTDSAKEDLIIPLHHLRNDLFAKPYYTVSEFLQTLQLARGRLNNPVPE